MTAPMRLKESALAHQLPYWWVGDRAFVMHDGTLALAWRVTGVDVATLPDDGVNQLTHHLRAALNLLPVGMTAQFLKHVATTSPQLWDRYGSEIRTADPILRELRKRTTAHLRGQHFRASSTYLVVSRPQALGALGQRNANGFARLVNTVFGLTDPATLTREKHQVALDELVQGTTPFIGALVTAGLGLSRLGDAELAQLAYGFLNPTRAARGESPSLVDDEPPAVLDPAQRALYRGLSLREQLVTTAVSWSADTLYLDDPVRPHRVLGLKALPPSTRAKLIREANYLPFPHWFSVSVSVPDTEKQYQSIEKRRNRARVAASGFARDIRADTQASELEAAMHGMVARDQRVFQLSMHLLFGADDLLALDRRTTTALDVLRPTKLVLATEQQAQLFAGKGHAAPHRRTCLTDNAADLLPVYEANEGDERPLFVVSHRTGEPYKLDLASPTRTNWNSLVFGGSGGGKSFLVLSLVTSSMLAQGSDLIIIDVGGGERGSYYRLCKLLGGDLVDLSLDGRNAVNPFPDRDTLFLDLEGRPSKEPNPLRMAYLLNITKLLVADSGTQLGRVGEAVLLRAVLATYFRLGAATPIYDDLVASLEQLDGDEEDRSLARRMAKVLKSTLAGPIGKLINQQSKVRTKSSFVVFDLKGIDALGELAPVMLLVVSSYVWNMVGRKRDRLAWLIYDECWALMRYPAAAEVQAELYRTARKLSVGVISVTQQLDDFLAVPTAGAIHKNATTSFLLKPADEELPRIAATLGLNGRERDLLAGLTRVKGRYSEFFMVQLDGPSRLLRYSPSAWEYWLNTTDPTDRLLEADALRATAGDRLAAIKQLVQSHPNGAAGGAAKKEPNHA